MFQNATVAPSTRKNERTIEKKTRSIKEEEKKKKSIEYTPDTYCMN